MKTLNGTLFNRRGRTGKGLERQGKDQRGRWPVAETWGTTYNTQAFGRRSVERGQKEELYHLQTGQKRMARRVEGTSLTRRKTRKLYCHRNKRKRMFHGDSGQDNTKSYSLLI